MQERWLKIIGQDIRVETYKEEDKNPILDSTNHPLKLQSTNVLDQQQQQQLHYCIHFPKPIYYKEIEQHGRSQNDES